MNRWRPNGIVTVRGQSCPPWWRCHFCHSQPYSFVPSRGSSCGGGRGDPVCLGVTAIWGHTVKRAITERNRGDGARARLEVDVRRTRTLLALGQVGRPRLPRGVELGQGVGDADELVADQDLWPPRWYTGPTVARRSGDCATGTVVRAPSALAIGTGGAPPSATALPRTNTGHARSASLSMEKLSHVDLDISGAMQCGIFETRPEDRSGCEFEFARKRHDDAAVELELDDLGPELDKFGPELLSTVSV